MGGSVGECKEDCNPKPSVMTTNQEDNSASNINSITGNVVGSNGKNRSLWFIIIFVVVASIIGAIVYFKSGNKIPSSKTSQPLNQGGGLCPHCRGPLKPGSVFCSHCGKAIKTQTGKGLICQKCGAVNDKWRKFCTKCGQGFVG